MVVVTMMVKPMGRNPLHGFYGDWLVSLLTILYN